MKDEEGNEIVHVTEANEFISSESTTPFVYKSLFGGKYIIKQRRHFKSIVLDGYEVCDQCEKRPKVFTLTFGEEDCGREEKNFCSKECLIEYLKTK
jgi:hypothetical protein